MTRSREGNDGVNTSSFVMAPYGAMPTDASDARRPIRNTSTRPIAAALRFVFALTIVSITWSVRAAAGDAPSPSADLPSTPVATRGAMILPANPAVRPSSDVEAIAGASHLAFVDDGRLPFDDETPLVPIDGPSDVTSPDGAIVDPVSDEASSTSECGLRDGDELWLVSSRDIGCPGCDLAGLRYRRREGDRWELRDRGLFEEPAIADRPTVVFVHGNRTDLSYAIRRGNQAYRAFVAADPTIGPVRFVVWAWPSERDSIGVRDFRLKAHRADLEGCLFGTFLARLPSHQPLNLIGYSYGSRIVLGGITMLTGRPLHGRQVELPPDYVPPPIRVTLIAAATAPSSLLPGQLYGSAYELIDRLLLINNSDDRALRLYRFVDRAASMPALGSSGLAVRRLVDGGLRVEQRDVAAQVGSQHKIDLYFGSPTVGRLVREQVAWIAHEVRHVSSAGAGGSP